MSTKIYDAFIFDKKYSILQLDNLFKDIRIEINAIAKEIKAEFIMRKFIGFYDLLQIRGVEYFKQLLENANENNKKSNKQLKRIYESIISNNMAYLNISLNCYFDFLVKENKTNSYGDSDFNFKCMFQIFQIRGKLLAMYFGRNDFLNIILNHNFLSDYHYQNSSDRPSKITEKEWKQRYRDWDKAIGPDYIPINHGVSINLFNEEFGFGIIRKNDFKKEFIPSLEKRAKKIVDSMYGYPNAPSNDAPVSDWMRYLHSEEYLNWRNEKIEEIKPLLEDKSFDDWLNILFK